MRFSRRAALALAVPVVAAGIVVLSVTGSREPTQRVPTHGTPVPETRPPTVAVRSLPPVKIGEPVQLTRGVTVSIGKVTPVNVSAHGPGEIAGSAVSVEVRVVNSSSGQFDLGSLAVNASYGGGTPAVPNDSDPAKPFSGVLERGGSAVGIYVFTLPASKIVEMKIDVSSGAAADVAVFVR